MNWSETIISLTFVNVLRFQGPLVRDIAETHRWNWQAELIDNPDQVILGSQKIAITSDSVILDGAGNWINLGAYLTTNYFHEVWLIDFSDVLNKPEKSTQ